MIVLLLFMTGAAHADVTLTSETTNGNFSFSETLSGSGDIRSKDPLTIWGWNLALTSSVSKAPDGTGGRTLTNRTTELAGGGLWDYNNKHTLGFGLIFSRTPEEFLTTTGLNLDYTYTFEFERDHREEKKENPWLALRAGIASNRYLQSFGSNGRRVTRPTVGDNSIRQTQLQFSIKAKPLDWFKVRLALKRYIYDRDVKSFLSYLDSALAVRLGFDGLASAVSGFPESGSIMEFTFYPAATWELVLSGSSELSAFDGSRATSGGLQVTKEFAKVWRIGLGVQTQKSEATSLNPEPLNQGVGLLIVSYDFIDRPSDDSTF